MRDYVEQVKELRDFAEEFDLEDYTETAIMLANAADAIEELRDAFCLLCGTCTSPPSAETFYACKIARRCLPEPPKEVE